MTSFNLPARQLPLDESFDCIVVGGGPAGCTAAAAAAREGARTLLIEGTGALGGMGTSGLVPAWCPFSDGEKIIYRGLAERVFVESKAGLAHVKPEDTDWVAIDPERLKRVYDELVTGFGVTVRFFTQVCAVEPGEGRPTLVTSSKAGLEAYRARVVVDCTGDGDMAAWAGAPFDKGDPDTGEVQPATLCFVLTNVDTYAYLNSPPLHWLNDDSPIWEILRSGEFPEIPDYHVCNNLVGPGTVGFNAGHLWKVDNTDPRSIDRAMVAGRRLAEAFRRALAKYHPRAFGNAHLAVTAPLMGCRETRRITGDYVLTMQDYLDRRSFADEIARNCYFIDIHRSVDETEQEKKGALDLEKRLAMYKPGESHGIPYRCLTPQGLSDVLVAGRAISCDRTVQGSVRVMPVCLATGEAAGIAAAMAAASDPVDVHAVDVPTLRDKLKHHGAWLPEVDTQT